MPLLLLEAPTGLTPEAKELLLKRLTEAVDGTYAFPDTRIYLREYPTGNVAQDGAVGGLLRPVAFLEAPELTNADQKRQLVINVHAAIEESYRGLADVDQTLVLINEYPLENVGWLKQLQSENPQIVEAVRALNAPRPS